MTDATRKYRLNYREISASSVYLKFVEDDFQFDVKLQNLVR